MLWGSRFKSHLGRALADILRNQGPIPVPHYERENMTAIDGSPKDNSPVRTSKNHFTPVRTSKGNHGLHGKDSSTSHGYRSGGPDLHNFISSGFVTLGRGHLKGTVETTSLQKVLHAYDLPSTFPHDAMFVCPLEGKGILV
ncbi:hypothetical protein scyTo_0014043 [Scyliorhinus torazame]|uniref:Uncharacterized protein n=1 Tax=Scyliorhinus torazame TaxID=75743 RepID=A0A401NFW7_SCYTO|nr:hypothetical protein [Scyliorhinus torazame]